MALVGCSITKSCVFRDAVQEFSNIYHYRWIGVNPGEQLAEALIDKLVALERPLHANSVTFVRGRVWSAGGTKAENNMIFQKALTGVGTGATAQGYDKERAYLIRWRAGVDTRGKPVYLRKWFHLDAAVASIVPSSGVLQNATGWTTAQRTSIANVFNPFNPLDFGGLALPAELTSATGRSSVATAEAHKYLEHHQLGDNWRT
jgi:hypothetical protein